MTGQVAWKLFYNKDILIKCGLTITVDHNKVVRHKIDRGGKEQTNKLILIASICISQTYKL